MNISLDISNKNFFKPMISITFTSIAIWIFAACSPADDSATPQPKKPSINVLTYNIHHGNPPTREKGYIDLKTIAETIRSTDPHLVAFGVP